MPAWRARLRSPIDRIRTRLPSRSHEEPGAALFRGLRLRLTGWYGAVLAATILLIGVVLYAGLWYWLIPPVGKQLGQQVTAVAHTGDRVGARPCAVATASFGHGPASQSPLYFACYDTAGTLIGGSPDRDDRPAPPGSFLSNSLVSDALNHGSANDIVDGGSGVGPLYRYARVVRDPGSPSGYTIIQLGQPVAAEEHLLAGLRRMLLILGLSSLALATIGGLWLSNRALAPARLAFARQQAFIADASHELRTPLTLLRADAEVLLRHRAQFPQEDAELLEDIVGETEHMSALTSSLLALARLDAKQLTQERDVVDISQLAGQVAQRMKALAEQKQLFLTEELGGDTIAIGDPAALEQTILILLDNAVKYTPEGGRISLSTERGDGQVRLTVRDTGIGILPEHLPRLTERFYRVDVARSRAGGGMGLGLAIASGVAAAHGGRIQIESEPGRGTIATLILPAAGRSGREGTAQESQATEPRTAHQPGR